MTDAIPWKSRSSPKAFVSLSNPRRSTKRTDVRPTLAPDVTPKTAENTSCVAKLSQKLLRPMPI